MTASAEQKLISNVLDIPILFYITKTIIICCKCWSSVVPRHYLTQFPSHKTGFYPDICYEAHALFD